MPRSRRSTPPNRRQIEQEVERVVEEDGDRLFIGTFPTGISYADRRREQHGDYLTMARLPFRSLALEWVPGVSVPVLLRERIERHARGLQDRRGEPYQVTTSGQTVILGA